MKILVVDDDVVCRTLIVKSMRRAGYDTVEASDARQAFDILRSDAAISLLITDVIMPEMDGFGLLDHVRNFPSLARLPVLVCSALGSRNAVSRAAHLNITGYLLKPIDIRRLRQEVGWILGTQSRPLAYMAQTLSRLEVDEAGYLAMLTSLLEKLHQDLADIKRLCACGDSQRLSARLAGLSGAAKSLGAEALVNIIETMTRANAANDMDHVSRLIPEMERVAVQLKEAVHKLGTLLEPANAKR